MAKLKISKDTDSSFTMLDMKMGQIGQIDEPEDIHDGKIVMRLASRVVELEAPYHSFSGASCLQKQRVRILPAGAEVTLTQEGE